MQKDSTAVMREWAANLRGMEDDFERGYAFSNNHFAGFAPETIDDFRAMLGLERLKW